MICLSARYIYAICVSSPDIDVVDKAGEVPEECGTEPAPEKRRPGALLDSPLHYPGEFEKY